MSMRLRRGMISETGAGWAVTGDDGIVLPGRWPDRETCWQQGFLGVYMLSGLDVVEVDEHNRPVPCPCQTTTAIIDCPLHPR